MCYGYAYDVVNAVLAAGCRRCGGRGCAGRSGNQGAPLPRFRVDLRCLQTNARTFCGKQKRKEKSSAPLNTYLMICAKNEKTLAASILEIARKSRKHARAKRILKRAAVDIAGAIRIWMLFR